MTVVRADDTGKSGIITGQIIQHIIEAKVINTDLSFHNSNVFYESSLRHACHQPTVQLIRVSDYIPFELSQFRFVKIDTNSIYTFVPKFEVLQKLILSEWH